MYYTQKELLSEVDKNFKIGTLQLEKGNILLSDMKEFMPELSILLITSKVDLSPSYICPTTERLINMSREDAAKESQNLLYNCSHPDNFKITYPKFIYHAKFGDSEKPFTQFQRFKLRESTDYFLTRTTVVGNQEYNNLLTMHHFTLSNSGDPFAAKKLMDNKEMEFTHQHYPDFLKLTVKEKRLLAFLGTGWRPKDIADKLCTSYENIRKQIKQINTKLGLTHTKLNKAAIYSQYTI